MADSKKVVQNKITLITAIGKSNDKKENRALPWLVGDPAPTADVIEEIVNRFHVYAMLGQRKLHSGDEEEKRIAQTFLKLSDWEGIVRLYFKDKAMQIGTEKANNIAQEARNLVDKFRDWFELKPKGPFTEPFWEPDWEPYMKLLRRWERVVARFNMCMNSGNQANKPAETGRGATTGKRQRESWLWRLYEKTLKVIIDAVLERVWPK